MKIRKLFLMALAVGVFSSVAVYADDYVDDIYFNPKKDKNVGAKKKNPNYIENFADIDVDTYNLRGQYYTTPIDTIGSGVGTDQDFVYTQQIQKYYNPTIVLDNSQLLADVLQNSYGNVEIVYNGITPAFFPIYDYGWPYYRGYYNPWAWNISLGGWSIGGWYDPWYWGPSWSWGWGPSWSWGPSWGWGPGWGPAPSWGPGWGRPNGTWSPGGNRPLNPGTGWAGNHRPSANRPMAAPSRPGNSGNASSGSQWSIGGNHRGSYGQAGVNSTKQNAPANGNNNRGYTIGNDGHRYTGSGATGNRNNSNVGTNNNRNNNSSVGNNRNSSGSSRNNSYNNSNNNRNSNSGNTRSSGNYNSNRSSGNGSFGSGSFGGGHRSSGGGGGGRGGRR